MIAPVQYNLPGQRQSVLIKWTVFFLGLVFFMNCFTPLRIHYDMLRYFAIKDCIEGNCPPYADRKDYLPYGFTALLLLLSKLGILRSFSIVIINCLYLLGGIYCVRKIFAYIRSPYFMILLILLNWTVLKFVVHPLSELQYLFFSMVSIYAFFRFTQRKNYLDLVMAFLFAGLAFLTRTVGITLVAALGIALIWEFRKQLLELLKKNKIIAIVLVLGISGILIFSKQLGLNHYTGVMSDQFKGGVHFSQMIGWHFSEWGEILMNTSKAKIVGMLPGGLGEMLFFVFGVLGFCVFLYICYFKKNAVPFIVKAYLLFYILLMFNWPFYDPRFWVPIVPLIAAVVAQTSFSQNRLVKTICALYLIVYSLFGIVSMGFMTYTSFNKKAISKIQAAGVYRNEYEVHFFGKTLSDTATHTDPDLVNFLNRYDR